STPDAHRRWVVLPQPPPHAQHPPVRHEPAVVRGVPHLDAIDLAHQSWRYLVAVPARMRHDRQPALCAYEPGDHDRVPRARELPDPQADEMKIAFTAELDPGDQQKLSVRQTPTFLDEGLHLRVIKSVRMFGHPDEAIAALSAE